MPESRSEAILAAIGLLAVCAVIIYNILTAPSLVPKRTAESTDKPHSTVNHVEEQTSTGYTVSVAKININTADIEALKSLYGIGDVKAQAIIDYRESNGEFYAIEELKEVSGIGDKLFDKIKNSVTV